MQWGVREKKENESERKEEEGELERMTEKNIEKLRGNKAAGT